MHTAARPVMEFPFRAHIDAYEDGNWIEVKTGLRDIRNLRAVLLELAYVVSAHPSDKGLLVLVDPEITEDRLEQEWQAARRALRPDLPGRLSLIVVRNDQYRGFPENPDAGRQRLLKKVLGNRFKSTEHPAGARVRRADYACEVLKLLVHQWLTRQGPMTVDWLMRKAGCSYPTVAGALRRFSHCLRRHSDRRIELSHFPRDEWLRLIVVAEEARATARFADRSGRPRSPENLVGRLRRLKRADIAVGGVLGARRHHPDLDLIGTPRLDLTLHCPGRNADWSFVPQLDPALAKTERRDEPAVLVVHHLRRADPLFQPGEEGFPWADPVECLLDLHEARLEPQALEFLNSFRDVKGESP